MDAIYARQRHFYDLTRKYYLLGRDRLIGQLDVPPGGTVLEIGCGTGRNLIAVARRYPTATLYGLDISDEMLATARASVARAGLSDRIALKQADATHFDAETLFGTATFDSVFFSYTLSMIPDWQAAMRAGAKASRGSLHLVDFGQFERLPQWFRRGMTAWLARFDVEPRAALAQFVANDLSDGFREAECRSLFRDYTCSAALRR